MAFDTDIRQRWVQSRCDRGDKILDIGSAHGWIFDPQEWNITYVDINEFDIPNFVCADAHNLPFEDNSFDICCMNEILEHVNDPVQCLKEAVRVCSKKVIYTIPNEWEWTVLHKPCMRIEERLQELGGISVREMYMKDNPLCLKCNDATQIYHHRWYNRNTLEADLKQIGHPYSIDKLNFEGWSFFIGEVYKQTEPDTASNLKAGINLSSLIKEPNPAPSVVGAVKYETLNQPKSLHIDTWAYCNARCRFCRYPPMTRKKGKMDRGLLEHILDEASQWPKPLKEIVPIHYGEFFLQPDWYEVLKMIEGKLPRTSIILPTNGSLLDPEVVSKLAEIQTLKVINISVNAYFKETYEDLMGLNADTIPKIKQAIRHLKVLAPQITAWVSMVYDPAYQTEKEQALFAEAWKHSAYVQVHPASFCQDYRKLVIPSRIPCRSIFIDFIILWDGRVVPCCWDSNGDMVMGDVKKQRILDIWHGKPMNNLRKAHNEGRRQELKVCSVCSFS